jgi:hypothetical protein
VIPSLMVLEHASPILEDDVFGAGYTDANGDDGYISDGDISESFAAVAPEAVKRSLVGSRSPRRIR